MNFQELMNKASANKIVASKQLTKSGRKHKDSEPGISNSAVKAFLERKEQERKKKQADEGAAKRARIEARLRQNLKANQEKKGKSKSTPESLNPPYAQGGEEEEKSIQVKRKKDDVSAQRRKSGALSKPSVSGIKNKDINHKNATTNNIKTKNNERISKEKSSKSKDFVVNEKKDDTSKAKNKSKIASAPQNFKELLAIAEQNKSGLKRKTETVTGKGQVEVEASKVKRRHNSVGAHELAEIDERSMRIKDKCRVKEKAVTKARGKQTESQWKTAVNSDKIKDKLRSRGHEGSDVFKRSRESDTLVQNLFDKKAPKPLSHYAIPREQKNFYAKPKHGYYYDEEEEDSDLDGFIDDGGDETCSDQTDVSKCIKDIFGYDRRRYAMEDDDGFAMESNYGQIEREEKRSAKIAKLEDEIEILKEQAELKRLRDKLKKSKKPKK